MRAPTEKALASMGRPRRCSSWKVSRALWPMARITWEHSSTSSPAGVRSVRPTSLPSFSRKSVTWVEKRTSPPRAITCCRMERTTPGSLSVPMWGLAS